MKQVKKSQRAVVLGSTLSVAALLMVAGAVRPLAQARAGGAAPPANNATANCGGEVVPRPGQRLAAHRRRVQLHGADW